MSSASISLGSPAISPCGVSMSDAVSCSHDSRFWKRSTASSCIRTMKFSSVAHSRGQYVDGPTHTNGIESFWAPIKRAHKGTFHKMSRKHLHRYVCEFVGHHNTPSFDTEDTMRLIVLGMVGRRLTWKELTKGGSGR